MEIFLALLFAAFVIALAALAGHSLDRARAREANAARGRPREDSDLYGDF